MDLTADETITYERTFGNEDVSRFAEVSRDRGEHHVEPNEDGRVLVHGLLTATLPTKIGGDHDVLASEMTFEFRRPVWTGETIRCAVTFTTVEPEPERDRMRVAADFECVRQEDDTVVLSGRFSGVVRDDGNR